MQLASASNGVQLNGYGVLARMARQDGIARHRHLRRLITGGAPQRDSADAVHQLCALHGAHPSMADVALTHCAQPAACDWLQAAVIGFTVDRSYLAQLTAAVGPMPSTPRHADSEAALAASHRSLVMLADSDRRGCASGAVAALLLDWAAFRRMLDAAAERCGIVPPPFDFPAEAATMAVVDTLATTPAEERALAFGAEQLFAQHRCLFDLLEARAEARNRV